MPQGELLPAALREEVVLVAELQVDLLEILDHVLRGLLQRLLREEDQVEVGEVEKEEVVRHVSDQQPLPPLDPALRLLDVAEVVEDDSVLPLAQVVEKLGLDVVDHHE